MSGYLGRQAKQPDRTMKPYAEAIERAKNERSLKTKSTETDRALLTMKVDRYSRRSTAELIMMKRTAELNGNEKEFKAVIAELAKRNNQKTT